MSKNRRRVRDRSLKNGEVSKGTMPVGNGYREPGFLSRRTPQPVAKPETDWLPIPALVGMLFVGLIGYFVAEASLASYAHPLHWLATLVVGSVGYAGGLIWHRIRGF